MAVSTRAMPKQMPEIGIMMVRKLVQKGIMRQEAPSRAKPPAANNHWYCGKCLLTQMVNNTPRRWGIKPGNHTDPIWDSVAFMLFLIQTAMVGSKNASEILATTNAPAHTKMYGSWKSFHIGVPLGLYSFCSMSMAILCGLITNKSMQPSTRAKNANTINGTFMPRYS
ncbi:hypothetical protein BpHYR1_014327 [Brachionus plicatilis]|uniref:Uncharacterized protein n=1 Tax=Brachionus plicatilis TaxID=10195 RepID=A0A3M7Q7D7_BRAPC|nr:hypothetical protein BpHYR1_014327 [Brachionus plicatilis]